METAEQPTDETIHKAVLEAVDEAFPPSAPLTFDALVEKWLPPNGPLFHVRFIENGVEQEQIIAGVADGNGNLRIDLPTPCTLLYVKEHRFPFCEVCDVGPKRKPLFESESMPGTAIDPPPHLAYVYSRECEMYFADSEWPDVISVPWLANKITLALTLLSVLLSVFAVLFALSAKH